MLGVAIMTVVLGGGLLAFRTIVGNGDNESPPADALAPTTPPISSTAVLSAAPSATALVPPTSATTQNAPVATPVVTIEPAPQPAAALTTVVLADRFDCNAIRGTAYRSDAERVYFESNCQTLATAGISPTNVPPTAVPPAIVSEQPSQPVATTPPTSVPPTSIPTAASNPARDRLVSLTSSLTSASSTLAATAGSPNFSDAGWVLRSRAAAQQVENLTGAISAFDPPSCLRTAFSTLRAAASELSTATGFISSGLDAADADLLQAGAARLASGRNSLSAVAPGIANAAC